MPTAEVERTRGLDVVDEFLADDDKLGPGRFKTLFPRGDNGEILGFECIQLTMTSGHLRDLIDREIAKAVINCKKLIEQMHDGARKEREQSNGNQDFHEGVLATYESILKKLNSANARPHPPQG